MHIWRNSRRPLVQYSLSPLEIPSSGCSNTLDTLAAHEFHPRSCCIDSTSGPREELPSSDFHGEVVPTWQHSDNHGCEILWKTINKWVFSMTVKNPGGKEKLPAPFGLARNFVTASSSKIAFHFRNYSVHIHVLNFSQNFGLRMALAYFHLIR